MFESQTSNGCRVWRKLCDKSAGINLKASLSGGQSFRWKFDSRTEEWTGVFGNAAWKIREDGNEVSFKVLGSLHDYDDEKHTTLLKNYLRLDVDIDRLYRDWSKRDKLFAAAAKQFYGVRLLDQDPVENLFSFICSSNNHISRISSMIEKLCTNYGSEICTSDDETFYSFPDVDALCVDELESRLRELGFGYRSKYIHKSAIQISQSGGKAWFATLKDMPYEDAKRELLTLPGIGPKVADCICLMSLNHLNAIPVDTHVFQIASNNYLPHLKKSKTVTEKIYTEISDYFRTLFGLQAGWAHTVLFCADLKKFEGDKKNKTMQPRKSKK